MVTSKQRFPCKNCEERHVGCHGSCEKYKVADDFYKSVRAQKQREIVTELYRSDSVTKVLRDKKRKGR